MATNYGISCVNDLWLLNKMVTPLYFTFTWRYSRFQPLLTVISLLGLKCVHRLVVKNILYITISEYENVVLIKAKGENNVNGEVGGFRKIASRWFYSKSWL